MLKVIIVDDEMRARRSLQNILLQFCKDVEVVATCDSVAAAEKTIAEHQPDLIFCDIEMPGESGFDLFKKIAAPAFETIFTTGHREYALQAYEVEAIAYLLKPIDIEKLEQAVAKARTIIKGKRQNSIEQLSKKLQQIDRNRLEINASDGTTYLPISDLLYLEADGAYTRLHNADGTQVLASKKLKVYEALLQEHPDFYRVHRSYIVNAQHLTKFDKAANMLTIGQMAQIPISRDRKAGFVAFLKK